MASNYRPDCWFGEWSEQGQRHLTGCLMFIRPAEDAFEKDGTLWVAPGGGASQTLSLATRRACASLAHVGGSFDVHEGLRVVASGSARLGLTEAF